MDVTFGALDAFAFVVFAVIAIVVVVAIVSLGKLPGQLARKWGHPQAAAINVAGWIGVATGGVIWPLALIWAFMVPKSLSPTTGESHTPVTAAPTAPPGKESRS
jgi:multisubunit Na+/H+ antiporter MnhB subunit